MKPKPVECEFESDVLAAVIQSRWHDRVDAGLCAHVSNCEICSDVVAVATAIEDAREEMRPVVGVPDSGRVWRLAVQLRLFSDRLRMRRWAARRMPRRHFDVVSIGTPVDDIERRRH